MHMNQKIKNLKKTLSDWRDKTFPTVLINAEESEPAKMEDPLDTKEERSFTSKMIAFRGIGLVFVSIGYLMYNTLDRIYILVAAYIISLALEGVIKFFAKWTHSRGIGITISYLLLFLFLSAGTLIIIPFLLRRGTEILNNIISSLQAAQTSILQQGLEVYLQELERLPDFAAKEILKYVETTNTTAILATINNNL